MSALDGILQREFFGIKLGLDSMRALCRALGDPQLASPTIIVAGTNGKGSVVAMAATALQAAGWRVGRYTSPHLVSLNERFCVDSVPADEAGLERAAAVVLETEARERGAGRIAGPMTFFELTTATAFEYFRRQHVDIAVHEVGMGGRFDATNVVSPAAAAITTVDLDHVDHLGDTIARIAFEKAGIIKPGVPVVTGRLPAEADAVVARVAEGVRAPLIRAQDGVLASAALDAEGRTRLRLATGRHDYGTLALALRGLHQADNAVLAARLLETVHEVTATRVGPGAIASGLTTARWPGRLDLRRTRSGGSVLFDAAHNPAGAAALAGYLGDTGMAPLPIVFGVMRDKDASPMLEALGPVASRLVFTQAGTTRARPASDLPRLAGDVCPGLATAVVRDPAQAVCEALGHADRICVTGSIVLVGDVLRALEAQGAFA
jgi:dihydrofolate synthase/folylpolyglutamate synthase